MRRPARGSRVAHGALLRRGWAPRWHSSSRRDSETAQIGGEHLPELLEAADGRAALAKVAAKQPDAIVLDGMMPELGGREVLAQLRRDPRTRPLPVVALFTWHGTEQHVYTFRELMSALSEPEPPRTPPAAARALARP
jgi:CheY-like chemotaxis protein